MFTAELLLTMPVFMVFLWAVVEFGIFFSNLQIVSLASRIGAQAAAEFGGLPSQTEVPAPILTQIDEHLRSAGIVAPSGPSYCRVRLEHNVGGPQDELLSPSPTCSCEPTTFLASPPVAGDEYIRLTVCVPMSYMMPNLLQVFGFDVTDASRIASCTTVVRYEL